MGVSVADAGATASPKPRQLRRPSALPLPAFLQAGSGQDAPKLSLRHDHTALGSLATMGTAYIFTLQPTFTQGLVLGQLSILILLFFILKYLFFISSKEDPQKTLLYQPRLVYNGDPSVPDSPSVSTSDSGDGRNAEEAESADWLNFVLQQVRSLPCMSSELCIHVVFSASGRV